MTNLNFFGLSGFCKLFIVFFIFQIGNHATAQKISLPIYTINKDDFDVILNVREDNSKLTASISIENSALDLTKKSSLYLFAFHKKDSNSGDRRFIKSAVATISKPVQLDYYPFIIANTEEKLQKIKTELNKPTHSGYKSLAFVSELEEQPLPDGTMVYSLIFTIYSSKSYKVDLDKNASFADMKLLLTRVISLNPCPPARPTDY